MGIAEFVVPAKLDDISAEGIAKRVGEGIFRSLNNILTGAQVEVAKLKVDPSRIDSPYCFEVWSGTINLGDVYLAPNGDASSTVRVEASGINQANANRFRQEYMAGH